MVTIQELSPDILINRHQLSVQQINLIFGEGTVRENIEEKLGALEIVSEFIKITDTLRAAGISFIPLKGPILSHRLYNDATFRQYNDLDILIEVSSISKATVILKKLGYNAELPLWPVKKYFQSLLIKHANDVTLTHPINHLTIELHWRLLKTPPISSLKLENIIRRNQINIDFAGRSFSVFSNELELLYLIIHGGIHWWRRLKWFVDVDTFLKIKEINWEIFMKLSEELKASRMVTLCNSLLSEYIPRGHHLSDSQPANSFMVMFSNKMIQSQKEPASDFYSRIFQSVYFMLISFPGLRYKIRTIRNYLFVKEFFGKSQFLSSVPMFYIYGTLKLAVERFKR